MIDTWDILMWYWLYKNFIEDPKDKDDDEKQDEIEEIMDEYGIDEDEAEEILDDM